MMHQLRITCVQNYRITSDSSKILSANKYIKILKSMLHNKITGELLSFVAMIADLESRKVQNLIIP